MISASPAVRFVPSAFAAALALLACSAASAADSVPPRAKDSPGAVTTEGRISAPNARLVALVAAGGKLIKSKGVDSVTRINEGRYCIRPQASLGIDPSNSIAIVSVEYFYSNFNEVTVQWASRGSSCGSDRFAVYTFGDFNLDARYKFSNDVGFTIIVP
jgi:opacity protein-like surface antigen